MSNPLYAVGEEAVLQSVNHPEVNGDCTVLDVEGPMLCVNAVTSEITNGFNYKLTIMPDGLWCESALRKKHKPSGESLADMIAKLNGVTV